VPPFWRNCTVRRDNCNYTFAFFASGDVAVGPDGNSSLAGGKVGRILICKM
jgi:hypothetical protein